jgi:hypothetical protein
MIKYILAAVSVVFFVSASSPSKADPGEMPSTRIFPSSVGEVIFPHQMHISTLAIKCIECHHQIDARKLQTPHPDYFKSSSIKCETCHNDSANAARKPYMCSECHQARPKNIADETLGAKVVIHKQCWKCHEVGTGKEASNVCKKCHSGKKSS